MSRPIEDYALVGDTETAALVARDGSVDWMCVPRFDQGACFAALVGDERNGRWKLAPRGEVTRTERRYLDGTLVLATEFTTADGTVRILDFMPPRGHDRERPIPDLVRIVEGVAGRVPMEMELIVRLDYGWVVPWATAIDGGLKMIAGPDALQFRTPIELTGEDRRTVANFDVQAGDRIPFTLTWHPATEGPPERLDPERALENTCRWWRSWTERSTYSGPWAEAVQDSLAVLKGLTYGPTGAIVAAPTTSLPEHLGGSRNWDYRYTWLRDATFVLQALLRTGYEDEARSWREWLLRAIAGDPGRLQIMYGLSGERRLTEVELDWLPGYEGSVPVRAGNAAYRQRQVDVYGELLDMLHLAQQTGLEPAEPVWSLQRALVDHLEGAWHEPDCSLWEIRGDPRHYTHSKIMAWVAFDRAADMADAAGLEGPVDEWRQLADTIHREVCDRGYDVDANTFTQVYGGKDVDAALLLIPQIGFLPPDDRRVRGTIEAVRDQLMIDDRLVLRYPSGADGLEGQEGAFLFCSFWLAEALALVGEEQQARSLFERLLELRNDVGLLSEEYDPSTHRMLGNFPQAFSHVGLVNCAANIAAVEEPPVKRGPARQPRTDDGPGRLSNGGQT